MYRIVVLAPGETSMIGFLDSEDENCLSVAAELNYAKINYELQELTRFKLPTNMVEDRHTDEELKAIMNLAMANSYPLSSQMGQSIISEGYDALVTVNVVE